MCSHSFNGQKTEKLPPLDSDDQAINQSSKKCSALEPTILAENVDNCDNVNLSTTFLGMTDDPCADSMGRVTVQNGKLLPSTPTQELIKQQESDPDLIPLWQEVLDDDEAAKVPTCFYRKSGVLMRKWRSPTAPCQDEWQVSHQIVVPSCYHNDILHLAHSSSLAGHLGINKTYQRVIAHFYWPGLRKYVANFCKICHTCQMMGKPNQHPPNAL